VVSKKRILVVEDDPLVRPGIREALEDAGYDVVDAADCRTAEESFRAILPDVVVLDYQLPDGTALDLIPRFKTASPSAAIVILTAHGTIGLAVESIKAGAEQFLTKPVELTALLLVIARVIENQRVRQKQLAGQMRRARDTLDPFVGASRAIRTLEGEARLVLETDSPVLVLGETGSGKGVLAGWLHRNGTRAAEAFVDVNCAGISRELLESELFGHERGSFTGASATKLGLLEVAHHGTVFLDEVGDMDSSAQAKLLKVIEEKRFRRVGEVEPRQVDIRMIAATHQDLPTLVRNHRFREDLYYRLNVLPLRIPPLRDRAEDIPLLAADLIRRLSSEFGNREPGLSREAQSALCSYEWPGNIRELRNTLERALLRSGGREIEVAHLALASPLFDSRVSLPTGTPVTLEEVERLHIARILAEEGGNVDNAARRLGVPRSTLYKKIGRFGI
jgi:DNA-binding NtrC family response regulator